MSQIVLTALGPDRPGIVGEVTTHLHRVGCNILDTRMVNLRGQFVLMILVECEENVANLIQKQLSGVMDSMGLQINAIPQTTQTAAVKGLAYRLRTYSADQPGIVARLTMLLREFGVNVEELSAWQESAAFAGSALFRVDMRLTVPPKVPLIELRTKLNQLCDSLNCDIDLEPVSN